MSARPPAADSRAIGNGRFCRILEPIVEITYTAVVCREVRAQLTIVPMNAIAPMKQIRNITPPEPAAVATIVKASKKRMGILMSIHFAHIWGHCSVSDSRFVTETIANVVRKMTTAESMASYVCVKAPAQASTKHTTGDVIKAIPGLIKARITKITKNSINIGVVDIP